MLWQEQDLCTIPTVGNLRGGEFFIPCRTLIVVKLLRTLGRESLFFSGGNQPDLKIKSLKLFRIFKIWNQLPPPDKLILELSYKEDTDHNWWKQSTHIATLYIQWPRCYHAHCSARFFKSKSTGVDSPPILELSARAVPRPFLHQLLARWLFDTWLASNFQCCHWASWKND